jgi:hypothetical protein
VLEKLTLGVASAKRAVEEEVTETQAAQTQLDRAAEDFKALAAERAALVGQWDDALEAMRRRDEAVQVREGAGVCVEGGGVCGGSCSCGAQQQGERPLYHDSLQNCWPCAFILCALNTTALWYDILKPPLHHF